MLLWVSTEVLVLVPIVHRVLNTKCYYQSYRTAATDSKNPIHHCIIAFHHPFLSLKYSISIIPCSCFLAQLSVPCSLATTVLVPVLVTVVLVPIAIQLIAVTTSTGTSSTGKATGSTGKNAAWSRLIYMTIYESL
jgi:hypothetical protein